MSALIEVEAAQQLVDQAATEFPRREVTVAACNAVGSVLARGVISDIDVPPYRKALMDGFAVRSVDASEGATLDVVDEITAGDLPSCDLQPGQAARIMTGAPLPANADAVVKVEDTESNADASRVVLGVAAQPGDNLMERGYCVRRGEEVLPAGHCVSAQEVGFLCEIGAADVSIVARPRVAILATGDELVSPREFPGPGQIRNSNASMLAALAQRDGAEVSLLGIAPDNLEELAALMTRGLEHDLFLMSGGVSVGIRDLVPDTLLSLGVENRFHGVRLKPGKPVWFGVRLGKEPTLVFGLPGNPMSTFVGYELFVRRSLDALCGRGRVSRIVTCTTTSSFCYRSGRRTFHQARLVGQSQVELLPWKGSVDQRVLTRTDALVDLPPGAGSIEPGTTVSAHKI